MNRQNLTAVTRKVKLPGGGIGKAVRWMKTVPRPSADGPSAGPVAAPNRQLVGVDACLGATDSKAHNASAHALRQHGIALTEAQLEAIKMGIESSEEGSIAVWITLYSTEESRQSNDYVGVSFRGDDDELFRHVSISPDDFREGGDEVNDITDHLSDFGVYGLKTGSVETRWESFENEYERTIVGHMCNLRLAV